MSRSPSVGDRQARSLLKDAEGKKKLSKQEAKELENDLRHDINTRFGTRNENYALDVYERRSGTEVSRMDMTTLGPGVFAAEACTAGRAPVP